MSTYNSRKLVAFMLLTMFHTAGCRDKPAPTETAAADANIPSTSNQATPADSAQRATTAAKSIPAKVGRSHRSPVKGVLGDATAATHAFNVKHEGVAASAVTNGAGCPTFVATDVSAKRLSCTKTRAAAFGLKIGDDSNVQGPDFKGTYTYDSSNSTLKVSISQKPSMVSCVQLEGMLGVTGNVCSL